MATLASDLAAALDPVCLARAAGVEPDDWQKRLLRSDAPRTLLNASRQSGKSTATAILALHRALYAPGSLTLLLSPSLRQSSELFRKVLGVYRTLGRPVSPEAENALSLTLKSGSRIVSLPGTESTIRGFSGVKLLVIDEAAWVSNDLYFAVRPMLATSNGRLIALSTPFGTRGWWYDAWTSSEPWARFEVPATECPRISALFLDEERRNMGEFRFAAEYMCRFLDNDAQAFRREDIDAAFSQEVQAWSL